MFSKRSVAVGLSFGLTSGIITTLGMIVGLNAGTSSKLAVIGGILTIAIADSFSDALGIHVSQESENNHTEKQVWVSTVYTFLTKFLTALTFVLPVLLLPLETAVMVSVVWGLSLLSFFSVLMAKREGKGVFKVAGEHILIAVVVIIVTSLAGTLITKFFV